MFVTQYVAEALVRVFTSREGYDRGMATDNDQLDAQWSALGVDTTSLDELVIDHEDEDDDEDEPVRITALLADRRLDDTTSIHLMRWYVDGDLDYRPWLQALSQRTFPAVTSLSVGYAGAEFETAKVGMISAALWARFPGLESADLSGAIGEVERFRAPALKTLLVQAEALSAPSLRAIAESDLPAIESLDLDAAATFSSPAGPPLAALEAIFRCPLPALRTFKLAGVQAGGALDSLLAAPWLGQLQYLRIMGVTPTDADRDALARARDTLGRIGTVVISRALASDALTHPRLEIVER